MLKKKEVSLRARPMVMITVGIKVVTSLEETAVIVQLPFCAFLDEITLGKLCTLFS